ncbi:hypothetical protein SDC9_148729 [bioreactor metagenome]|uniref:Uncharacterized protein n=1 Tax=bioreactor metagenome TaxID=1076179 RepID=A0A645EJL5_9ZZZZ
MSRASSSVAFADAVDHWVYNFDPYSATRGYYVFGREDISDTDRKGQLAYRHKETINTLFFDGHVGSMNWNTVRDLTSANATNPFRYFYTK